jgi:hypothetical protein
VKNSRSSEQSENRHRSNLLALALALDSPVSANVFEQSMSDSVMLMSKSGNMLEESRGLTELVSDLICIS